MRRPRAAGASRNCRHGHKKRRRALASPPSLGACTADSRVTRRYYFTCCFCEDIFPWTRGVSAVIAPSCCYYFPKSEEGPWRDPPRPARMPSVGVRERYLSAVRTPSCHCDTQTSTISLDRQSVELLLSLIKERACCQAARCGKAVPCRSVLRRALDVVVVWKSTSIRAIHS